MAYWHDKSIVNPDIPFAFYLIEPKEWPISWHEEIEVIYLLEGVFSIELDFTLYELKERDILLIGSGDIHWTLPQPQRSRIAVIKFDPTIFDTFLIDPSSRQSAHPFLCLSKKLSPQPNRHIHHPIERLIRTMVRENQSQEKGFQLLLKARIYDLVTILLRQIPMDKVPPKGKKKSMKRIERLKRVFQYIDREYQREIALEAAAREANLSIYYFTRFFKDATGKTFIQYLTEYRVKKAQWYLTNTEDKVVDIACNTGFNNSVTFNRIFKEMTGLTPTEYKKSLTVGQGGTL